MDKNQLSENYFSGSFTAISEEQFYQCLNYTQNPQWANGNLEKIKEYYKLHGETILDRMLQLIACYPLGVIIHGNKNQEDLDQDLKQFDINRLLLTGPYQNSILSEEAQKLIYESLHGMKQIYDVHLHNLGYDEGNYLNPNASVHGLTTWKNYFTFMVLRYASGMSNPIGSTHEARKRIHLYAAHFPKLMGVILPIQKAILENSFVDWKNTGNYLKNFSTLVTAESFIGENSNLLPAVSIHPFDNRWKEKLQNAHQKGIRLIKWMPPQSIPPDSNQLNEFYLCMNELGMKLIAHTGPEHTIPTNENNFLWNDWGNPLRFRKALQLGVDVIFAHCGHKDLIPDLDHPSKPLVCGCELFFRVAKEAYRKNQSGEWKGRAYGDLAAVMTHYGTNFIKELLLHVNDVGIRYIYGSDYPYTNLIQPKKDAYDLCAKEGLLEKAKVKPLKEIRNWNPLLANYVFTRNLEMKTHDGCKLRFPENSFTGEFAEGELILYQEEVKRISLGSSET